MSKKTVHVVTALDSGDPKRTVPYFEKGMKEIYRKDQNDLCLCFSHHGAPPFETADMVKKKKADMIVFDSTVPATDIISVMDAVRRRISVDNRPSFVHIAKQKIIEGTVVAETHENARELVFN